jgi:predicted RNase H-like nuclease (RuvC/YqgF family)
MGTIRALKKENKELRAKVEESLTEVNRLVADREKLMDINNSLKAEIDQRNDSVRFSLDSQNDMTSVLGFQKRIESLESQLKALASHNEVLRKELKQKDPLKPKLAISGTSKRVVARPTTNQAKVTNFVDHTKQQMITKQQKEEARRNELAQQRKLYAKAVIDSR